MDLAALLTQKRSLLPPDTNVFRLIDGFGDSYPDVFVDRLGDRWLISTRNRSIPQRIAKTLIHTGEAVYHKQLDKDNKLAPVQIGGTEQPSRFLIKENGIKLWLDMAAGYSQGLFLDQRNNRQRVRRQTQAQEKILNTFSYTGAFSLYAALAGAETTTLDLAQPCLDWAKENMIANNINPDQHHFCKGDTLHWLKRFIKQERRFNGIILDPPTFSRDKDGTTWQVERDYGTLAALAYECLAPQGWMLCTTNCRKLNLKDFIYQLKTHLPSRARYESSPMPADFTGEPYLKTIWVTQR